MSRRTWRFLIFCALLAVAVTSCSSGDDDAAFDERPDADAQPEVGPDVQAGQGGGTTTIDDGEQIEPSVLNDAKISRVFVAANGNDGKNGSNAANAVKSFDRALQLLTPGGTVVYQPGTYPPLDIIGKKGSPGAPIRIEGSGQVEFRDKDYKSGAGVLIRDSQHIELVGVRTRRSLWGIYVDNSHHVTLRSNNVGDVGQEGIRIKGGSSNIRIDGNTVADTGRRTDKGHANGEGIYIGTGSPGGVDHVKNVVVINNRILRLTDEAIDVKRPSTNIDIIGNSISEIHTQTTGAIVVHLGGDQSGDPKVNIERNVIRNVTRSSPYKDGNCIVSQVTVRIVNNVLHDCQHRGIFLKGSGGTATILHNTLIDTGSIGQIVDEGRGMNIVSENNLGAGGDGNRQANANVFSDANGGNYRIRDSEASAFKSAPNKGVSNDLLGSRRPSSGAVTFGAVEASGAAPPPTTQPPTTTIAPTTKAPTTTQSASNRTPTTKAPDKASPRTTQRPSTTTPQNAAAPRRTAPKTNTTPSRTAPTVSPASRSVSEPAPNLNSSEQIPESLASADPPDNLAVFGPRLVPPAIGRSIGEPAAAGPLFPGDEDERDPFDNASCFDSLVCMWAPFL